jgi:hypothetical protein
MLNQIVADSGTGTESRSVRFGIIGDSGPTLTHWFGLAARRVLCGLHLHLSVEFGADEQCDVCYPHPVHEANKASSEP